MINVLLKRLEEKGVIQGEEIEIYSFGLECLFLKLITLISYLIIAVIIKKLYEFVIIMFVFVPLRRSAGGYHAKTRFGCYLVSCLTLIVILFISSINIEQYMLIILLMVADIIFCFMSPVDNENKRMEDNEIIYFRVRTRKIVVVINIIYVFLTVFGFERINIMVISGMMMSLFFLIAGKLQEIVNI